MSPGLFLLSLLVQGRVCRKTGGIGRQTLATRSPDMHINGDAFHEVTAMTTFDDRENAFEAKFAHDAEMQFKAQARANKLLGLWAAEKLGKSGDDAAAYAVEVITADFEEAGHEDVVRKVVGDLGDKVTADEVRAKMAELQPIAKAQLMGEAT